MRNNFWWFLQFFDDFHRFSSIFYMVYIIPPEYDAITSFARTSKVISIDFSYFFMIFDGFHWFSDHFDTFFQKVWFVYGGFGKILGPEIIFRKKNMKIYKKTFFFVKFSWKNCKTRICTQKRYLQFCKKKKPISKQNTKDFGSKRNIFAYFFQFHFFFGFFKMT